MTDTVVAKPEPGSPITENHLQQHVTPRAFWLGLTLSLLMCAVMPYNDYYIGATYLSGNWFPIGGVAALLLLSMAVNPLLLKCGRPDKIFSGAEIMTVWAMIVVVAGIPSSGLMRYLIPHMVAPHYFANAENRWETEFISRMPARLIVSDPAAVKPFFEGLKPGQPVPWHAWYQPLFYWSLFVGALYCLFFCLSTIVRKQWIENEHYAFPLVKLASMMSQEPERGYKLNLFLRDPLLWSAVAIVTAIHTVKGLHLFFPTVPDIPLLFHSGTWITTPPWNSVNDITIAIYPLVIGLSYLLASDVCLSLWLFYVFFKLQVLIATMNSWDMSTASGGISMGPAFVTYQEAGGSIALIAWLVWSMRGHLKIVWQKAVHGSSTIDDSGEPMPYRLALFGFVAACAGLYFWLTVIAEIQPSLACGMVIGSIAIMLMLSWLVAQAGVLFMQTSFSPAVITADLFSKSITFSPSSLAMAAQVEHVGWYDAREMMMPSLLNSQKGASETNLSPRSLAKALAVCIVLAVVVSAATSIWLPYTHGGGTGLKNQWMYVQAPQIPFTWAASVTSNTTGAGTAVLPSAITGAIFVGLLFVLRAAFVSFPISPAGFLVAATYPMYMLWFSTFLGWACKAPILRYGGMNGYRRLLPFFLGLILGDSINAIIWTVVGLVTHTGYSLLPG